MHWNGTSCKTILQAKRITVGERTNNAMAFVVKELLHSFHSTEFCSTKNEYESINS